MITRLWTKFAHRQRQGRASSAQLQGTLRFADTSNEGVRLRPQKVFNGVQKLSDTKTRSALGYSKVLCICFVLCASASLQVATHRDCQCDKKCNGRSARQRAVLELLFPVVRTSSALVMFRSPNHCDVHAAYSIGSCPCTLRGNLPP